MSKLIIHAHAISRRAGYRAQSREWGTSPCFSVLDDPDPEREEESAEQRILNDEESITRHELIQAQREDALCQEVVRNPSQNGRYD